MASFRKALESRAYSPENNPYVVPRNSQSGGISAAGITVTADKALGLTTVYACVRIIAGTISSLPFGAYVRRGRNRISYGSVYGGVPAWVNKPNPESTRLEFFEQVISSLKIHGNAFMATVRDTYGEVLELWVLHPDDVKISRPVLGGGLVYTVRGADNVKRTYSSDEILHISDLKLPGSFYGVSPLTNCRLTLGNSLASESFASSYFANSANAGGVIIAPPTMVTEQIDEMANRWKADHQGAHQAGSVGILTGGADFKPLEINALDAQLIQSRQFNVEDISRIYGVPLSMLSVSTPGSMSYASVEANNLAFVQHTLRAILERLEQAFSQLLPEKDGFVKFNLDALLRGTTSERYSAYAQGISSGFLNLNTILSFEDQQVIADGDIYRVPLQNIDINDAKNVGQKLQAETADVLIQAGFDPAETLKAVGLDPITHKGFTPAVAPPVATP